MNDHMDASEYRVVNIHDNRAVMMQLLAVKQYDVLTKSNNDNYSMIINQKYARSFCQFIYLHVVQIHSVQY